MMFLDIVTRYRNQAVSPVDALNVRASSVDNTICLQSNGSAVNPPQSSVKTKRIQARLLLIQVKSVVWRLMYIYITSPSPNFFLIPEALPLKFPTLRCGRVA